MKKTVIAVLFVILSLLLVLLTGCSSDDVSTAVSAETTAEMITETLTEAVSAMSVSEAVTELQTENETESAESTSAAEETTESVVPETVEDIVELFNESVNRIKPEAKKVVKNYEKRIVHDDKLVVPASLDSTARSMIKTFMKDDTDPIVYETREEITNEFLVPDQSYVSVLRPEHVESATCTDNGKEYIVRIRLKDSKNATAGEGAGAVCDVIEAHEVAETVSFVKKFTTEYNGCEVTATIDKKSGKTVHMKYITPVVLDITVDLFGTHDAKAGFTFEKDYSITY
ncbi:MAG: hypothetical protein IJE48_00340 [Clostridia bacterium]|nr:hypothetical protein [Clostridia bacterium]